MKFIQILSLSLLICSSALAGGRSAASCESFLTPMPGAEEVAEIIGVAEKLIKKFSPKKYVILGIGQSPTAIIAHMQNRFDNYAQSVPLSRFRHQSGKRDSVSDMYKPLTSGQEEALFMHFDHFIPSAEEMQGRKLVIMDFVSFGDSLLAATNYIQKYMKLRGRQDKVIMLAVVGRDHLKLRGSEKNLKSRLRVKAVKAHLRKLDEGSTFADKLLFSKYDDISEYGEFRFTTIDSVEDYQDRASRLVPLDRYSEFKEYLSSFY